MAKKKSIYWVTITILLLGGVAGWAFYSLLNEGVKDLLFIFGVENFYLQNFIIIGIVFILLIILGLGGKKAFEKIVK